MKKNVWEKIFNSRNGQWSDYPPEDLIRFIKRFKSKCSIKKPKLLELGCGPGSNINFFIKEGFEVFGIDLSKTAISVIKKKAGTTYKKNFKIGNFIKLPWSQEYFDGVIDNFSIYANKKNDIQQTYLEIKRVLKNKGFFFFKSLGNKNSWFWKWY